MNIITGAIDSAKPEKSLPSPTKTRTGLFPAEKKPQQRAPDAKLISKVTADRLLARKEPHETSEPPPEESRPKSAKAFRKIPSSKINSKRWSDDPVSEEELPSSSLLPLAELPSDFPLPAPKPVLPSSKSPRPESSRPPEATSSPAPVVKPPPSSASSQSSVGPASAPPAVVEAAAAPSASKETQQPRPNVRSSGESMPKTSSRPSRIPERPTTAPALSRLPQPSRRCSGRSGGGFPGYYGLYGQVAVAGGGAGGAAPAGGGGAPTIVYTNGPLPASTTSVILVPLAPAWGASGVNASMSFGGPGGFHGMGGGGGPGSVGGCESQSLRSVASDMSVDPQQPVMVCIDRNAHKEWFDENVPSLRTARIKRYKSVETFMHFMEKFAGRKIVRLRVFMLIRITDVEKLLNEINTKAPHCLRCFKGIYVYEHCFAGGTSKSLKPIPENIKNYENLKIFPSVELAYHKAQEDLEPERKALLTVNVLSGDL